MAKTATTFDNVALDIRKASEIVFLLSFFVFNQGNAVCFRKKPGNCGHLYVEEEAKIENQFLVWMMLPLTRDGQHRGMSRSGEVDVEFDTAEVQLRSWNKSRNIQ